MQVLPYARTLDTFADVLPPHEQGFARNRNRITQLALLVAFTGAVVGMTRPILSLMAVDVFGVASATAALAFLVAFGLAKAFANLCAGSLSDRFGRRHVLMAGWAIGLPVPLMVLAAPSWTWVVVALGLLGISQGLAWSMALNMKVDLAGAPRRGLAVGLNESVGYLGVAAAAVASGALADHFGLLHVPLLAAGSLGVLGLLLAGTCAETAPRTLSGHRIGWHLTHPERAMMRDPRLLVTSFGGFANNMKDGLIWGLVPLLLAARGMGLSEIGIITGLYPAVWAVTQFFTGMLSDRFGRLVFIIPGFLIQAAGLVLLAQVSGFTGALVAAGIVGVGTGFVYPTLISYAGDLVTPRFRASGIGMYRLFRDLGYVGGALIGGTIADLAGLSAAVGSGAVVVAVAAVAMGRLAKRERRGGTVLG